MRKKTNKKSIVKAKTKRRKTTLYTFSENPLEFYISEETASYGRKKPFSVYYDAPEHSIRLLK
ncbi:MAG: hypothetical protein ACE5KK_07730, partial [Candidatus Brocadiales bacterium]